MTDPRSNDSESNELDYVKVMKVAVAVACISLKPAGMAARDYVQQLCNHYQLQQHRWKEKCQVLENELLHLKQTIYIKSCNISGDGVHASPDKITSSPKQHKSTAESMEKHTLFLQSFLTLRTINKQSVTDKQMLALCEETVTKSLYIIKQCISEGKLVSTRVMQNCLQQINKYLYVFPDCTFMPEILDICTVLIHRVLCVNTDKREDKESFVELVKELCHPQLINSVFASVIEKIEGFSHHLRQVIQGPENLNTKFYENMYYIFKILQNFIRISHESGHFNMHKDCLTELKSQLDDSLLHISDKFPLYAHMIWKMQSLLE